MNRFELRIQRGLTALVVVTFAAFWGLMWLSSGPPEFTEQYFMSAIFMLIIGFP